MCSHGHANARAHTHTYTTEYAFASWWLAGSWYLCTFTHILRRRQREDTHVSVVLACRLITATAIERFITSFKCVSVLDVSECDQVSSRYDDL